MAYKPEPPPDKEIFPRTNNLSGGLSLAENAGYIGYTGYKPPAVDLVIDELVVAILIDSAILGTLIWFALRGDWRPDPGDSTPVFYAAELPFLRTKSPEQLRLIFNGKTVFGGGMVRQ
jgi:hypothetical protein